MFDKRIQNWYNFPGGVLARTSRDADYLYQHLILVKFSRSYLKSLEVHDFQRYKVIKKANKILDVLRHPPVEKDFVFLFHLN